MSTLEHLYPERVFYYFKQIAAIPHGSGNTKAISDYLVKFAKEHALTWYQDEANNVVLVKEASKGYENAPAIIIQGHMDMVCEKEKDCNLDMDKEGLRLYVDGDFLKAEGTTLGGDDGIAVAYALAILESDEISHPKLEVVITVDEEIGMLGAAVMDLSMLTGHTMLNIDSDEEGIFLTGCAGGMALNVSIPVTRVRQTGKKLSLIVTGLSGGHSGSEIDKEHGNADLLMGRLLYGIFSRSPFGILTLHGGLKDNAIPRECEAEILIPEENTQIVCEYVKELNEILKKELVETDPGVQVLIEEQGNAEAEILDYHSVSRVIFYLRNVPNGIQHMSQLLNGQVETSLNLGILELKEDALTSLTSIRSSVKTRKEDLCARVTMLVEMLGGEAEVEGDYPAWEYRTDSALRPQVEKVYEELFHKKPVFSTIHAGLECGLLSEKIPDLDCVSFGPDNFDIHTPKEHLSISSTARVWDDDDIPRMKRDRKLPTVLTKTEISAILDATPNLKHKAMIATMYSGGLRVSEVTHLHYDDISRTKKTIHIRDGKSRSDRYTLLADRTLEILTEYWFQCGRPRGILFPSSWTGDYLTKDSVIQFFRESAKRAGIQKHVSTHCLRHSFASHLFESGCDVKYIQALLGHRDPKSTEVYLHVSNKTLLGIRSPFDEMGGE